MKKLALATALFASLNANAALYDRGNGMIYDSTLNITWLQDANYAKTSGYDADGLMTWAQATTWANNLSYGGYSDWRLTSAGLNGTNYVCSDSYDSCPGYYNGTYDYGFNNTRSELGNLFLELGNEAYYSTSGQTQGHSLLNSTFTDAGTNQSVSFFNANYSVLWEAEKYAPNAAYAWVFSNYGGNQYYDINFSNYAAWAVRDGDVAAVPIPATAWLFGSGLIGLIGAGRKRR